MTIFSEEVYNMGQKGIFITDYDLRRLRALINGLKFSKKDEKYIKELEKELNRANVVKSTEIPPDIITMNSKARLKDLNTQEEMIFALVFPDDANISEKKISILAPIGTALIGYRVGDVIQWNVPAGLRKLKVEEILYQPEAIGDYNL